MNITSNRITHRGGIGLLALLGLAGCAPVAVDTAPTVAPLAAPSAEPATAPSPATPALVTIPSLAPMLARVAPAVVSINTTGRQAVKPNPLLNDPFFRRFFNLPPGAQEPREQLTESLGSGVIIDAARGYVVTNAHVIEAAERITVKLNDGRSFTAEPIGTDDETDVALVRITADRLTALPLADSDRLRVGDFVVAIGNPFGLGQTATWGIVSALGRSDLGIKGYEDFIQTDASINPGNSGGALVSLAGQLVGINTAILAPGGGNVGINFAIPSNMVRQLVDQLRRYGGIERGQLGVVISDLGGNPDPDVLRRPVRRGALVTRVLPGSAAARAGVRRGDVIVGFNGKRVGSANALRNAVGLLRVGDRVEVELRRNGEPLTLRMRVTGRG